MPRPPETGDSKTSSFSYLGMAYYHFLWITAMLNNHGHLWAPYIWRWLYSGGGQIVLSSVCYTHRDPIMFHCIKHIDELWDHHEATLHSWSFRSQVRKLWIKFLKRCFQCFGWQYVHPLHIGFIKEKEDLLKNKRTFNKKSHLQSEEPLWTYHKALFS